MTTILEGPAYLWRGFRVVWPGDQKPKLESLSVRHEWRPGWIEATCSLAQLYLALHPLREPHPVPDPRCSCGIHGLYRMRLHSRGFVLPADKAPIYTLAAGVIEIGGRAVIGTHEVRAQRARLLAVAFDPLVEEQGVPRLAQFDEIACSPAELLTNWHEPVADSADKLVRAALSADVASVRGPKGETDGSP